MNIAVALGVVRDRVHSLIIILIHTERENPQS
jgi:hypothetical protein